MFAQLIASRVPARRSPAGFAASLVVHSVVVVGAAVFTSRAPVHRPVVTQLAVSYVAPAPHRPTPASPLPQGPAPITGLPRVLDVPIDVPSVLPSVDALRSAIGLDDPSVFRPSVAPGATGGADFGGGYGSAPLLEAQVEVAVMLDARSPMPRYPQLLKDAGVEGLVRLRFVVDTAGRVEPTTVQVVEASHPAFAAAVQGVLPRLRFTPARVGPRKVRQLVEFPLQFQLHR